jgi:hypothetical protein
MILLKQGTAAVVAVVMFESGTTTEMTGITGSEVTLYSWTPTPSPAGTVTHITLGGGSGFAWNEVDSVHMPGLYALSLPASAIPNEGDFVLYISATGSGLEKREFFVSANTFDDLNSILLRCAGMLHENSILDVTTFDSNNNLLSGRFRIYSTPSDAAAAQAASPGPYTTNMIAQYAITASYTGTNLQTYLVERTA